MLPEEIVYRLLTMMLGDLIKKYDQPIDLNERAKIKKEKKKDRGKKQTKDGSRGKRKDSKSKKHFEGDFVSCHINIGKRNGLTPYRLMGLVNQYVVGKKPDFGKIDIRKNECLFGIEKEFIDSVISQVSGNKFEGRVVEVRKDTKK